MNINELRLVFVFFFDSSMLVEFLMFSFFGGSCKFEEEIFCVKIFLSHSYQF